MIKLEDRKEHSYSLLLILFYNGCYYTALTFVSPAGHETGGEHNADLDDVQTALYGVPCSAALSEILSYHCNKY